ncbi:conserved hypothetical protein [Altererythrobacter sp. B11]|nr:conserved hypothetical protein [Altererythrobacter sp. B11]
MTLVLKQVERKEKIMATRAKESVGFGVPTDEIDPQRFIVRISGSSREPVVIIEDFGIAGPQFDPETRLQSDQVVRCRLDPKRWRAIAPTARQIFNERLKGRRIATGRWEAKDNLVHRLLGRELCVLAWAVETCDVSLIPAAIDAWTGLRPEERWWLYAMAVHSTGRADDVDKGWRKAIRIGLTEGAGAVAPGNQRQISFEDL